MEEGGLWYGEVWKENSEFLERRLDLWKKGGICNEKEVKAQRHIKKSCCGPKVKIIEEGDSGISKNEVNQESKTCKGISLFLGAYIVHHQENY
ncbi:hypothetical protein M0R45_018412 [Rubus argutus]|uniref:Uncharacterized protein n=1 Tax=Rubus argutus TaxID=59490 RepID=A0AAW1X2D9_RUBAR